MHTDERGMPAARHFKIFPLGLAAICVAQLAMPMQSALAQGCIVARGTGLTPSHVPLGDRQRPSEGLQTAIAYRWFRSDRAFVGKQEMGRPPGIDINRSHFIDVSLAYAINDRFTATLLIPYAKHDRSSVVQDPGGAILRRFSTQNEGLADLRVTGSAWLLDPKTHRDANVALGLGLDLPTGQDDARDVFPTYDEASGQLVAVKRPVDQSIQLGDGGYGVLFDFYAYWRASERLSLVADGYYAVTPEETNGVASLSSNPYELELSIADSYAARAGLQYVLLPAHSLTFALGLRVEGVPVHDVTGGSGGFRRPGYALSIEPGLSAALGPYALSLYAPLAIERNRQRSLGDERLTDATGVFHHGPAAFPDYLVMFSIARTF